MNLGFEVEIARDIVGVCRLRDDWQRMCLDFNADIDFYLAVTEGEPGVLRPHVIALRRKGVIVSILVCRIERQSLAVSLGYKKLRLPAMRFLTVVHGGVLGEPPHDVASALLEAATSALRDGEAEALCFHGLEADSPFQDLLRTAGDALTRDMCPEVVHRWRTQFPQTYQDFYRTRSANTRHNVKRYSKRLTDAYGDRLSIKTFRGNEDFDAMVADTEEIAKKTYLRGLGAGFRNDAQMQKTMRLTADCGWLRAYILYIDGEPSAFWNGVLYRRTFFTWTTGYDPKLNDLRPGTFVLRRMLEDLCDSGEVDAVDFGFGDAQYKREWTDVNRLHTTYFLFAPRPKALFVNAVRGAALGASKLGRRLLDRAGALQKLKKRWRAVLTNPGS
ncbi:MAG TPA: GNAT family N-acetyltransferase [Verrucomicrobiae bacterium]|nr:GNAT family N-acetyltransferase [Verrucomicrobiae bacterium]